MSLPTNEIYEFGPFRLDVQERLLLRDGASISLTPKAFELLLVLVERQGRLVEKDELFRIVWPDTIVEESNLSSHIATIRRALGDGENGLKFIETAPKRGYRFVAEVRKATPLVVADFLTTPVATTDETNLPDAPTTSEASAVVVKADSRRDRLWITLAGLMTLIAVVSLGMAYCNRRPESARTVRLSFVPPKNVSFDDAHMDSITISPDGQKLAFTARSADGKSRIWVRPLNGLEAQSLPGTEEPYLPFWSPDSRSIAFGAGGKLKRVELAGGSAQILCDASVMTGGSWSNSGVIVFGPEFGSALFQVSATGGTPQPVTVLDATRKDGQHSAPWFLPDGKHFLFSIEASEAKARGIWVGSIDAPEVKKLVDDGSVAAYAAPGWLVYLRNEALIAQAFDAKSLQLNGEAIPFQPASGNGSFSVSENGTLVWKNPWEREYQLLWFDREGRQIGAIGTPAKVTIWQEPHLSPNGKNVVLARDRALWVIDLARNLPVRLTAGSGRNPIWSPDGSHIAYNASGLMQKAANGTGTEELLLKGLNNPIAWSPDGRFILFLRFGEKTRMDVWALPLFGDRKEQPLLQSAFDERSPQLSPDGRWLAYFSDESGSDEIYVQSFLTEGKLGGDKLRISTNGGTQPKWRGDGQELFYVATDGQMMSVAVKTSGAAFESSAPKALFKTRMLAGSRLFHDYDVTADGQRFLIGTMIGESSALPPTVILNWTAELKK